MENDERTGLYRKYDVRRLNDPDGKHEYCDYFVLDLVHDRYARGAIEAYANACIDEFPKLSLDLLRRVGIDQLNPVFLPKPCAQCGATPTPPPVPAPVDVEAVVQWWARRYQHLGRGNQGCDAEDLETLIRCVYHAGLAARSAPVDAALLAQCREALEAAERHLAHRVHCSFMLNIDSCDCGARGTLDQVRAALLAIKEEPQVTPQLDGRLPQRFWDKVIVSRRTGCWLWTGARSEKGYAKYYHQGQMWRAHRLVYEVAVGPIPKGMQIDHVRARGCSSTGCVNPQHLEAVSCQENLLRGDTLAAANASKTHCHRGHRFPSGRRGKCLDCERDQIERKKGLGRCFSCPGSALPGTTRCLACRDRNRERSRERGRSRIRSRRR